MQDSYFGEIGNSFYAGPNGQSFKINEQGHFNNKAELDADVALRWASPIQPGDYVVISYGYPGDPLGPDSKNDYIRNSEIDAPNNYNGTVWQKKYNATQLALSYELIVSLQGATPYIEFTADELNPTSTTKVSITGPTGTPDNPEYVLHVAKAWEIEEGLCEVLGADGETLIAFNRKSDNGALTPLSDTTKYLHVCLPQTWDIIIDEAAKRRADQGIDFSGPVITNDAQGRAKTKTWTVAFPKPYNFDVASNILPATSSPTLTKSALIPGQDQDTYTFTFGLPRPWDVSITEGTKLPANESPTWTDTTGQSETTKSWVIRLPKAYQIEVAKTVLDPTQNPTVTRSALTDEDTYTFTFGLPKAWDIDITRGTDVNADQSAQWTETTGQSSTTKSWELKLPKPYQFNVTSQALNPTQAPSVTRSSLTGGDTYTLTFGLPNAWEIEAGLCEVLGADGNALIAFNRKQDNGALTPLSDTTKYLHVCLPQSWDIVIDEAAKRQADQGINFTGPVITNDSYGRAKTKTWTVAFPKPYNFDIAYNILPAASSPTLAKSALVPGQDQDTYTFTFGLPSAWDVSITEGTKLTANTSPIWTETTGQSQTTKSWVIRLPKAYDFTLNSTIAAAGTSPSASLGTLIIGQNVDTYPINLTLPAPWDITITNGTRLAANAAPTFQLVSSDNNTKSYQLRLPRGYDMSASTVVAAPNANPSVAKGTLTTVNDIDVQDFVFTLPKAWQVQLSGSITLDADQNPTLSSPVDDLVNGTRTWTLSLPKSYLFTASTGAALNADANATVSLGSLAADGRTLPLTFQFPAPWAIVASASVADPTVSPSVATTDDHQTKTFTFTLPRAWQITAEKGSTLPAGSDPTVSEVLVNSYTKKFVFSMPTTVEFLTGSGAPGSVASDTYYINTANGDFYGHGNNNVPVKLFSFTPPTPDVTTTVVNPYTQTSGSYTNVLPNVTGSQDSSTGKWIYSFTIPKMPTFTASTTTTGNGTLASITAGPSATDGYNFAFSIPKGTFWFIGTEFTTSSPPTAQYAQTNNARSGDIYLNTNTGLMWKWNSTAWALQSGTLKGPQGDGAAIIGNTIIDYHNSYIAAYKEGDPIPGPGDTGYIDGTTYYPLIYAETDILVQTAEIMALLYTGDEPSPNEMLSIVGQNYRDTPTELTTPTYSSYWCYYLNSAWEIIPIGSGSGDSRVTWGFWDSSGLHK